MARGETFNARVERIAAGGAGIARIEGKSVFVDMTAPGDLIKGRIKNEHKTWATGELLEVLEPSTQRTKPLCRHFGFCGGCSLQHLGYESQIEAKTLILSDTLKKIGGIDPPEIRLRRSEPFEYRNRVQFHCTTQFHGVAQFHGTNDNRLGFKKRKSSGLVAVEDCPVAEGGIRRALRERRIIPPRDRNRFTVFSKGDCFLSEGETKQGRVLVLSKSLVMDAGVFFQSNAAMLELLIGDLIALSSLADKNNSLADIYCGIGTFAAFLGEGFSGIDLVEENKAALTLARENMYRGKNVNYYALSDTDWANSRKEKYRGFMVLDPPREGLSGPMREYLAGSGPNFVAYVSCNPATLARDSRSLVEGGYALKELTFYDFYPQTAHIESLAVFCRR